MTAWLGLQTWRLSTPASQSSPLSKGKRKSRCHRQWLPFPGSLIHRDPYTSPLLPKPESSHQDQHPCFFPSSTYQITSSQLASHCVLTRGQDRRMKYSTWGGGCEMACSREWTTGKGGHCNLHCPLHPALSAIFLACRSVYNGWFIRGLLCLFVWDRVSLY